MNPLRKSALILFGVWFLGLNVVFTLRALVMNLIQGRTEVDPYQAWWVGIIGPFVLAGAWFIRKRQFQMPGPPWAGFLGVALLGVLAEETTCLLLGAGTFRKPGNVVGQFAAASLALYLACIGGWIAYRRLKLDWLSAVLLFGFAGYFLEAFPFQKLYRSVPPGLLYGMFPPVVAAHFILMTIPAYLLVCDRVETDQRWDHPLKWVLALVLPAILPTILVLSFS